MDSKPFARIAVGVDDSEPATTAVTYAARLARDHGGTLVLCHAVNWVPLVAEAGSTGAYIDAGSIIDSLRADGEACLDRAAAIARRFGVVSQRRMPDGDPSRQLLTVAEETGCDAIVIGTHGRRGIGRLVLGSTAEMVLRGSTIPVVTVRQPIPADLEGRRCFSRLLVAIDDSEPSDAALRTVFALPKEDRTEVLIATAVDVDMSFGLTRDQETQNFNDARQIVERAAKAARAHGVNARSFVLEGRPESVIVGTAAAEAVDAIVVGSHGRRGARRFFLGSVAEQIVRTAAVPTMVVRSMEAAALQPVAPLEVAHAHA